MLDDADPVAAARRIFAGAMMNAGQVCVAIKRAYVPEAMIDPFCDELVRLAKAHVVDDGARQGAQKLANTKCICCTYFIYGGREQKPERRPP